MTKLSFQTLREANIMRLAYTPKFSKCHEWEESDWVLALVGELGEAANIMKKVRRGDMTYVEAHDDLAKELADVQIYLDLLASNLGVDLGSAVESKFNEVSERVGSDVKIRDGDWSRDV